ncbi:hypothetical protein P872_06690 [Rhodonellum psychrophilum GCM71 = DSM 17998]|uniref:DUF2254 domain-containing protein n=2 Tax=Rhodonellum TaxID=336827 RepID=U5BQ48_9BACT|nr:MULTISPECIES: DUF2254 domain-containing protein [Rhodonellum]ERM82695.1 hypothetical protein P872_06690 [Rhodonellum psychrophilum GCM71 = DSM 17998]SDZ45892.1 Uncharacterized membrane protein [Rhodonellum ikkaensis]
MKNIWYTLKISLHRTTSSIAFIPTLFAFCGLALSFLVASVEYEPWVLDFKEKIGFLLIGSLDNGRLILGTLVASTISLMVFSFSMVMIVLSQASSSLSPRVLPGLISNKPHQIILGFYLATILFSLIMIINFQAEGEYKIPSLGILFAMAFGITSLTLFIYFIHSISKSIQVETILHNIFKSTLHQIGLRDQKEPQQEIQIPDQGNAWLDICTKRAGYLKKVNEEDLILLADKHDFQLSICSPIGQFLVEGYPFLKVNAGQKLPETVNAEIMGCFTFYFDDEVEDHYMFGFKQVSEIATKALSPGINDPGTAIKALDLLSVLFIRLMAIHESLVVSGKDGKARIFHSPVKLEELIFQNLIPIREFGKKDVLVMVKLLEVLKNMVFADRNDGKFTEPLLKTVQSCIQCADAALKNSLDREQINSLIQHIEKTGGEKYRLEHLR